MTTITCKQTLAITNHRILSGDLNEHETLFGGRLIEIIDATSSVSAQRACRHRLVTGAIDNMNYLKPFKLDDAICIESYVTGTGTRSMEVFVKVIGEHLLSGQRFIGATCFVTFVTTDKNVTMPQIKPQSPEEIYLCQGYEKRRILRKQAQKDHQNLLAHLSLKQPWLF